jgi:gliding motility-associated-like protein
MIKWLIALLFTSSLQAQSIIDRCNTTTSSYWIGDETGIVWTFEGESYWQDTLVIDWSQFETGTYSIKAESDFCSANIQSITINLINCDPALIWFANAFTPGNDLLNETWKPITHNIDTLTIQIWTREGQLVFEETDHTENLIGWTGYVNDRLLPSGVYVWRVLWTEETRLGTVHLIN